MKNKKQCFLQILCLLSILSWQNLFAQKTVISPTPPMGWMSWNQFEGDINETIVKQIADALVQNGMAKAGYKYIIIDDLWQGGRDENGKIFPDPDKFPSGIKKLVDYVHNKGLKFGIYTDIAEKTCAGAVGTYGYEENDAQTFADWGVDYIKCDYCWAPKDLWTAIERYEKFIKAVRNTKREIVFAICEWGQRSPWLWGESISGNLWRTTWDLRDTWEHHRYNSGHAGIMEVLDRQLGLAKFAGPGHWNDPDMLMAGLKGKGKSSSHDGASGCTIKEYETQFGLWCLLAAPLLACNDVRNMDEDTKRILTNHELIAVNQDRLGKQAERIWKEGVIEIWAKKLTDNNWAVGFLNRDDNNINNITLDFKKIGIKSQVSIRNLWQHENLGVFNNSFSVDVQPHSCEVFNLSPKVPE